MIPATAPRETIKIYDRFGSELVQFRAAASRSYVIAREGRLSLNLATRKTQYVNPDVLKPGNWILVQSDTLPDWVGVIDMPREWGYRTVKVYAYTPERVFSWRRGPLEQVIAGSPGALVTQLITIMNDAQQTVIRAGIMYKGGTQRSETLHPNPLSQNLANIQTQSREEYSWRPVIDSNGRLIVYCDWSKNIGDFVECPLVEGKKGGNIENTGSTLTEDGTIVNDLLGYGKGATWATRPSVPTKSVDTSLSDYGLMQGSKDWGSAFEPAVIAQNNLAYLGVYSQPRKTFGVTALNRGQTFQYMKLGNRLTLQMQSVGFTGDGVGTETTVRILGMGYDPLSGQKLQLVLQEVY